MLKEKYRSKTLYYEASINEIDYSKIEIKLGIEELKKKINNIIDLLELSEECLMKSLDNIEDLDCIERIDKKIIKINFNKIPFESICNNFRQITLLFYSLKDNNKIVLEIHITDLGEITFRYYFPKRKDPTNKIIQILY